MFTMAIDGRAYARRGTGFDTRLTVLDRSHEPGIDIDREVRAADARGTARRRPRVRTAAPATWSPRPPRICSARCMPSTSLRREPPGNPSATRRRGPPTTGARSRNSTSGALRPIPIRKRPRRQPPAPTRRGARPSCESRGAVAHPTPLVQSAAMAAVPHPAPSYRPMLPERVVTEGLLSDAQLESVALAGEAHARHLAARYRIGSGWETVRRCGGDGEPADEGATADGETLSAPVRLRRGWMLGDGTGAGKGRQVAALVLDRWLRGCKRALWLSQSDKLLEDARRDWTALGGREQDVIPLGKFRPGAEIPLTEGILFATYATLRSPARQQARSRLDQIVAWLAGSLDEDDRHAFDGVVLFDEAHAMANAAGSKGSRGEVAPSQQGRAGLKLQHALPDARVVYVSATGATTVPGLAYAGRLGLWAAGETPFETRSEFVSAMEAGGVAALEGRRPGPEGAGPLPGPRAVLRRRGGGNPRTRLKRRPAAHL